MVYEGVGQLLPLLTIGPGRFCAAVGPPVYEGSVRGTNGRAFASKNSDRYRDEVVGLLAHDLRVYTPISAPVY